MRFFDKYFCTKRAEGTIFQKGLRFFFFFFSFKSRFNRKAELRRQPVARITAIIKTARNGPATPLNTEMSCGRILKSGEKFVTLCGADARISREEESIFLLRAQSLPMQTCTRVLSAWDNPSPFVDRFSRPRRGPAYPPEILCDVCHRTYSFCIKVNKAAAWARSTSLFRSSNSFSGGRGRTSTTTTTTNGLYRRLM